MSQNLNERTDRGTSISVPIPAQDSGLYGSKATDDVLLFLSRNAYDRFTYRGLADAVDCSIATVRRVVDVLESNGLVVVADEGNRSQIGIDRTRLAKPDDPFLRIPQEEFQEPVKEATERLTTELTDVEGVVLYGSVAEGTADRRSDVDLWVLVRDDRASNQRAASDVRQELEARAFDGDRYEFHVAVEAVDAVPAFSDDIEEILRTGVVLYGTDRFDTVRNLVVHGGGDE